MKLLLLVLLLYVMSVYHKRFNLFFIITWGRDPTHQMFDFGGRTRPWRSNNIVTRGRGGVGSCQLLIDKLHFSVISKQATIIIFAHKIEIQRLVYFFALKFGAFPQYWTNNEWVSRICYPHPPRRRWCWCCLSPFLQRFLQTNTMSTCCYGIP